MVSFGKKNWKKKKKNISLEWFLSFLVVIWGVYRPRFFFCFSAVLVQSYEVSLYLNINIPPKKHTKLEKNNIESRKLTSFLAAKRPSLPLSLSPSLLSGKLLPRPVARPPNPCGSSPLAAPPTSLPGRPVGWPKGSCFGGGNPLPKIWGRAAP